MRRSRTHRHFSIFWPAFADILIALVAVLMVRVAWLDAKVQNLKPRETPPKTEKNVLPTKPMAPVEKIEDLLPPGKTLIEFKNEKLREYVKEVFQKINEGMGAAIFQRLTDHDRQLTPSGRRFQFMLRSQFALDSGEGLEPSPEELSDLRELISILLSSSCVELETNHGIQYSIIQVEPIGDENDVILDKYSRSVFSVLKASVNKATSGTLQTKYELGILSNETDATCNICIYFMLTPAKQKDLKDEYERRKNPIEHFP